MMILEWLFSTISPCDAAEPWQLGFQDAATPMMQGIIDLHHDIFFFLILILVFVLWIVVRALWNFNYKINPIPQRIVHGTTIEILWTIFPSIILMFIAIPSFALLYSMDEVVVDPAITIKAIGHQWYWTYEYSDYNSSDEQSLTFDSYMIPEDDLELGQLRFLEVDNRVVVPTKTHLRFIVTSADVLHSWAVPSLGVKCDAVPGRLNQISILVQREGVYYGQCSEICGTNHALMPIVIETVPRKDFDLFLTSAMLAIEPQSLCFYVIAALVFGTTIEIEKLIRILILSWMRRGVSPVESVGSSNVPTGAGNRNDDDDDDHHHDITTRRGVYRIIKNLVKNEVNFFFDSFQWDLQQRFPQSGMRIYQEEFRREVINAILSDHECVLPLPAGQTRKNLESIYKFLYEMFDFDRERPFDSQATFNYIIALLRDI